MYFKEHGIPHFHAIYGEYNGVFEIKTLEMYGIIVFLSFRLLSDLEREPVCGIGFPFFVSPFVIDEHTRKTKLDVPITNACRRETIELEEPAASGDLDRFPEVLERIKSNVEKLLKGANSVDCPVRDTPDLLFVLFILT